MRKVFYQGFWHSLFCCFSFLLFFLEIFIWEWYQSRFIHKYISVFLYKNQKICSFYLVTSSTSPTSYPMKAWKDVYKILIPIRTDGHPSWIQFLPDLSQPPVKISRDISLLLMAGEVTPGSTSFEQIYKYRQAGKHYVQFQMQIMNKYICYQSLPRVLCLRKEGKHVSLLTNPHYLCVYPWSYINNKKKVFYCVFLKKTLGLITKTFL